MLMKVSGGMAVYPSCYRKTGTGLPPLRYHAAVAKPDLKPNEQILYPNPFEEDEPNPIIVTTTRVLWSGDGKKQELDSTKISYSGKSNDEKKMKLIVLLVLLGLPLFLIGFYNYYSYRDKPMGPPPEIKGVPQKPLTKKDFDTFASNEQHYIIGIVLGVFGAAFGGGAYLLYKRRLTVVIAGQPAGGGKTQIFRIPIKDKILQDKLLTMVGASQTAAKAMVPPPMPAKVVKPPGAK
jgi:hypothetical protein